MNKIYALIACIAFVLGLIGGALVTISMINKKARKREELWDDDIDELYRLDGIQLYSEGE